ncbi:MAG TPA: c-type cytochrome [Cyclobacteriaceae bacterium]|nr:c-type cytochrome [Cyclobacteriaceae bacterium]
MKRLLFLAGIVTLTMIMASCGGGSKKEEAKEEGDAYDDYEIAENKGPSSEEQIAEGKTLVESNDCKTCHHPTNKIIGPSHTDVAKKYEFNEANVKLLADKIIKGGSGVWGEIPMSPHANVSQTDAEKMARYVLSLDGEKEH